MAEARMVFAISRFFQNSAQALRGCMKMKRNWVEK